VEQLLCHFSICEICLNVGGVGKVVSAKSDKGEKGKIENSSEVCHDFSFICGERFQGRV